MASFAIGIDFGTAGARVLIADAATGENIATATATYASGDDGTITHASDAHLARQKPGDWFIACTTALQQAVRTASANPAFNADRVVGIGVDATASTPVPVNAKLQPLADLQAFAGDPDAMAWLWKDHTAHAEAEEITQTAREQNRPYLARCGSTYSSEWFWSKILRCHRVAPHVAKAAAAWVEQSDLLPAWLAGLTDPATMPRNVCAAGHKAMYAEVWNGLPAADFLAPLDPDLPRVRETFRHPAVTCGTKIGGLAAEIAERVGLPAGIAISAGGIDAHLGALGSGIRDGTMVKIIGTSTCDILVGDPADTPSDIPGVCGVVRDSVIPGRLGIEAGQSAVGDIFDWLVRRLAPRPDLDLARYHEQLEQQAARLKPGQSGLLSLDWNNGNRCVLVNPRLTGLLLGQMLHTTTPEVYRALIEATAFGARMINERLAEYSVPLREIVACGGIAEKNELLMQIYADVCGAPIRLAGSEQACALGAAMCGAVAGGAHADLPTAIAAMAPEPKRTFEPRAEAADVYDKLFTLYRRVHDAFGGLDRNADLGEIMKTLIDIRRQAGS